MKVKINREISHYTESMFFGPYMLQFIFSVLACGVAVPLSTQGSQTQRPGNPIKYLKTNSGRTSL